MTCRWAVLKNCSCENGLYIFFKFFYNDKKRKLAMEFCLWNWISALQKSMLCKVIHLLHKLACLSLSAQSSSGLFSIEIASWKIDLMVKHCYFACFTGIDTHTHTIHLYTLSIIAELNYGAHGEIWIILCVLYSFHAWWTLTFNQEVHVPRCSFRHGYSNKRIMEAFSLFNWTLLEWHINPAAEMPFPCIL